MTEKLIGHAERSEIVRWTILRSRSTPYPPSSSQAGIGLSIPEPEPTHYPVFPCVKDLDLITPKHRYFFIATFSSCSPSLPSATTSSPSLSAAASSDHATLSPLQKIPPSPPGAPA